MTIVRDMMLTPSQAHELTRLGFAVLLVALFCGERDLYRVGVQS